MISFFHRLFHPHCEECKNECKSCETLTAQLEIANSEKTRLLDTILSFTEPKVQERSVEPREIEPIQSKAIPWRIQREMLETEDKKKAEIQKRLAEEEEELKKANEALEKQVGVNNG